MRLMGLRDQFREARREAEGVRRSLEEVNNDLREQNEIVREAQSILGSPAAGEIIEPGGRSPQTIGGGGGSGGSGFGGPSGGGRIGGGAGGGRGIVQQTGAPRGELRFGAREFDSNPFWDSRQVAERLDQLTQGILDVSGNIRDLRRQGGIIGGSENRAGSR